MMRWRAAAAVCLLCICAHAAYAIVADEQTDSRASSSLLALRSTIREPAVVVKVKGGKDSQLVLLPHDGDKDHDSDRDAEDRKNREKTQNNQNAPTSPLETQAVISPNSYPGKQAFLCIVTEYPKVESANRQNEYTKALQMNIDHPLIREIHLMMQGDAKDYVMNKASIRDPLNKIHPVDIKQQVLYSELWRYANEHLRGQVVIVMNADIEIGEGWENVQMSSFMRPDGKQVAFALSRYQRKDCGEYGTFCFGDGGGRNKNELTPDRHNPNYLTSHDTFVAVPPVSFGVIHSTRFKQNIPSAENRVVNAFRDAGYEVINPCFNLKTWHEHCSEVRKWGKPGKDWKPVKNGVCRPQFLPSGTA